MFNVPSLGTAVALESSCSQAINWMASNRVVAVTTRSDLGAQLIRQMKLDLNDFTSTLNQV